MFRKYDTEKTEQLTKPAVFEIVKELNSLRKGLDEKSDQIDMTDMQYEQVFALLDKDNNGYM